MSEMGSTCILIITKFPGQCQSMLWILLNDRADTGETPIPRKKNQEKDLLRKVNCSNQTINGLRNTQEQEGDRKPRNPCASCGELHFRNSCRYRNATFYNCSKPGTHFKSLPLNKIPVSVSVPAQPAQY